MLIRVNKKISARSSVKYAALASGTVSHVWYDEDSSSAATPKRRNRIQLMREVSARETSREYDA
jgi:hypothetical protein